MNTLTKIAAITLTLCPLSAMCDDTEISLVFGGYSKHYTSYNDVIDYNESHHIKGIMWKDFTLATFDNSYNRTSVMAAYNWRYASYDWDRVTIDFSVNLGLVSGYISREEMGPAYLGDGLSLYVLPMASVSYQLTDKLTFTLDNGVLPAAGGVVFTNNFRLTYKF